MNNFGKTRIVSITLALTIIMLSIFSVNSFASQIIASGYCGEKDNPKGVKWQIDDTGTFTLSGQGVAISHKEAAWDTDWSEYGSEIKKVIINDGITEIPIGSFTGCKNLKDVSLPNSLTVIPNRVFCGNNSLTEINLPDSIKTIEDEAFWFCENLTKINLPDGLENIYYGAFSNCVKLADIEFPDSVKYIGDNILENTNYYNNTENWIDGVLFVSNCLIKANNDVSEEYNIPSSTVCMADGAFNYNTKIKSISIPEKITTIPNWVFSNCNNLITVTLPDTIKEIGNSAFSNCNNLITVTLPDTIKKIGDSAFHNCASLINIELPDSLEKMQASAFSNCSSLEKITIPVGIDYMPQYAFDGCTSLKSIVIQNSSCDLGLGDLKKEDIGKPGMILLPVGIKSLLGDTATIYGYTNSTADVYASFFHRNFIPLITPGIELQTGDVNGDDNITSADARISLRYAAKLEELSPEQLKAADVNNDGKVTASDARIILRVAARIDLFAD